MFPEDIEEYFHQGLLSQPQLARPRSSTDQLIPDKCTPCKLLSGCVTQKEKPQIVPGMQLS